MNINNSPDFFQSVMYHLVAGLTHVEYFIDNIDIFSSTSNHDHLQYLHQVVLKLERNGFTINPLSVNGPLHPLNI